MLFISDMDDEFDELTGDPKPKSNAPKAQTPPNPAVSSEDLARLEEMSREELVDLIERVNLAGWGFSGLTGKDLVEFARKSKGEVYEALKLRAAVLAYSATDARVFKELASFWADREIGKAVERVETPPATNTTNIYGLPADVMERILRQQLERMEKQKQQVIEHKPIG
jgi:hypothetical protein